MNFDTVISYFLCLAYFLLPVTVTLLCLVVQPAHLDQSVELYWLVSTILCKSV